MAINFWPTQCRQHRGQYIIGLRLKCVVTKDRSTSGEEKTREMLGRVHKEHNKMTHCQRVYHDSCMFSSLFHGPCA